MDIEEWNLMSLEERVEAAYEFYVELHKDQHIKEWANPEAFIATETIINLLQNIRGC